MSRSFVGLFTILALVSTVPAEAAGPGGTTAGFRNRCWFTRTVTTTVLTATLEPFDIEVEPTGTGLAQYTITEVSTTYWGRFTYKSTGTALSISTSGLSQADDSVVSYEVNFDRSVIPEASVVQGGSTSLSLLSRAGDTIADLVEGDHLDVIIANSPLDSGYLVHGDFGAPVVTVTTVSR